MFKFDSYTPVKEKAVSVPQRYPEMDEMDWDEGYGGGKTGAATPGETIASSNDFMRYAPEVGDLVIARIVEVGILLALILTLTWLQVQPRRWKVDANGRQAAILMLSSVNLPGGIQRRKLESDELQMRTFFEEGDLLVAEVQAFFSDGAMSLHTRSLRYGKLRNGQFVTVPAILIKRLKSHFCALTCGVDVILGVNGYIWVSKHIKENQQVGEQGFDAESVYSNKNENIDASTRMAISRVSNIIKIMAQYYVPISDVALNHAYAWVVENDLKPKDILQDETAEALVEALTQDYS
ncbi:15188_t:CDS:2 [Acaulospora colombiana]|uniref:15188_t:CDS:1 n=1 Tax=Acaulospora colombiana TaxID=27376 RepID=A0ACA9LFT6_9GLOM|nr:15188_t:CDS:2 [Acaulospora colombiana]